VDFRGQAISGNDFFLFMSLAFLTKSIAALLFIPALVFLVFYFKKTGLLLRNKWFYIGFVSFSIVAIGYVLLRDSDNPGYINYLLHNDFGCINTTIESHEESFDFYLNHLFQGRFFWILLCIPGAVIMYMKNETKGFFVYLTSLFICYFVIISYSKTKLEWYNLPLFPILSVYSAFAIYQWLITINTDGKKHYLLLLGIFVLPVYFSCRSSYKSEIPPAEKKMEALNEYAFKHIKDSSLNHAVFLINSYDRPVLFYKYQLNEKGFNFDVWNSPENLRPKDIVILSDDSLKKELRNKYITSVLDSIESVLKIEVKSLK
jgi:hypothetical protein